MMEREREFDAQDFSSIMSAQAHDLQERYSGTNAEILVRELKLSPPMKNAFLEYAKMTSDEDKDNIILEKGNLLLPALMELVSGEGEGTEFALTALDEILTAHPQCASQLQGIKEMKAFFLCLPENGQVDYLSAKAAIVVGRALREGDPQAQHVQSFIDYVKSTIQNLLNCNQIDRLVPVLQALRELLRRDITLQNEDTHVHKLLVKAGGLEILKTLLSQEACVKNSQILYQASFCLWLLTFNDSLLPAIKKADVLRSVVEMLQSSREKVVRIGVAICFNVLARTQGPPSDTIEEDDLKGYVPQVPNLGFGEDLITYGLLRTLDTIEAQKWKDPEVMLNAQFVHRRLRIVLKRLSSLDHYFNEVRQFALFAMHLMHVM
jgi:hypothetical protein